MKNFFLGAVLGLTFFVFIGLGSIVPARAQTTPPGHRLSGHLPPLVATSQAVGRVDPAEQIQLALVLPLRRQSQLDDLLRRLYDPHDPAYGHYLTSEAFTARFGPTQDDYNAVIAYAQAHGLTVTGMHSNRLLVDVAGPAWAVQNAFGVSLLHYQAPDGHIFRAPAAEPQLPTALAGKLAAILGLDTAATWHAHSIGRPVDELELEGLAAPLQTGSGPGGGLTPSDIRAAYNLAGVSSNGSGQTLALFELAGYTASDITAYESHYGLPNVPLQNVLVDGVSGSAGSGADEVTLDIELQVALASGASKILVYEGPNSLQGVIDTYNRIATDNIAKQISTSWGLPENSNSSSARNSENSIFQQMAAQGQSIFAAAGDSGAYDNGSSLSVDDPASQPYMTGVGGTSLTTNGAGGAWKSETTWNGGSVSAGAGGGGISTVWTIPSYQSGVVSSASLGSTSMRNVPDVSLDADPNSGYSIYYQGGWYLFGGTSCAAPLWSAFTALVNQQRVANGSGVLGFANPALYPVGKSSSYTADFHDIADNSTNLYYPAISGYDDATGWGSFNGANLLATLVGGTTSPQPPAAPTGLTATAGNAQVTLSWSSSAGATSYNVQRSTTNGGPYTTIAGTSGTTYTDTGLTNGTTYYYVVSAANANGVSANSNQASATPTAPSGPSLTALSISPTTVVGGNSAQGTVTLSSAAPSGGVTVTLSSNNSAATVPASVTVTQGKTTATFTITTKTVSSNTTATISAGYNGVSKTASLSIQPQSQNGRPTLVSVTASPNPVVGGNTAQGTVTLSGPAPAGGAWVDIASGNTTYVSVPSHVIVPAGSATVTFTITTKAVTTNTNVTIKADYGYPTLVIVSTTLTLTP